MLCEAMKNVMRRKSFEAMKRTKNIKTHGMQFALIFDGETCLLKAKNIRFFSESGLLVCGV